MVPIFVYNILLIVLYAFAMAFSFSYYIKKKNPLFIIITIYLLFYIFDNVIIYITEFIESFAAAYNKTFMSIPAVKTIIYIANTVTSLLIVTNLLKKKLSPVHYGIIALLTGWLILTPLLPNSATKVWIYYFPNQILMIYLGIYTWLNLKRQPAISETLKYYLKWVGIICFVFGILILLEDTYVIYNVDEYSILNIKMNNRNICEDIFSIFVCILILRYFILDESHERENAKISTPANQINKDKLLLDAFSKEYSLTQREKEIFSLLLEHKQNNEIAEQIFLSNGTIKTHVHNIFIKLNIQKRSQIFEIYKNFESDFS